MTPSLTDNSKAALALTSRLVDTGVRAFTATEWADLRTRFTDAQLVPAAAFEPGFDARATLRVDDATAERMGTLVGARSQLAFELDRLRQLGIWAICTEDDAYPPRLRAALGALAPPVLFGAGPLELLGLTSLGVVGSRDVSSEGAEFARQAAEGAAQRGLAVTSGAARGVDQIAMNAAFASHGAVVGVLADSLETRIRKREIRRALLDERVCLVTPFNPGAGFSVGAAMNRNKVIYGLSAVVLVVESAAESGGTWAGATEALAKGIARVVVRRGPGEAAGNALVEARGATPVHAVDDIFIQLASQSPLERRSKEQLAMFDPPA